MLFSWALGLTGKGGGRGVMCVPSPLVFSPLIAALLFCLFLAALWVRIITFLGNVFGLRSLCFSRPLSRCCDTVLFQGECL